MDQRSVDNVVELLCQKGCRAVWSDIASIESGDRLIELRDLSTAEVAAVLAELKAVMAVYEGTCGVDDHTEKPVRILAAANGRRTG